MFLRSRRRRPLLGCRSALSAGWAGSLGSALSGLRPSPSNQSSLLAATGSRTPHTAAPVSVAVSVATLQEGQAVRAEVVLDPSSISAAVSGSQQ